MGSEIEIFKSKITEATRMVIKEDKFITVNWILIVIKCASDRFVAHK